MKLFLREIPTLSETEVEIRFRERDREVDNLVRTINLSGDALYGINEKGDTEMVYVSQILYIEAVDRDVFAYKASGVYRIRNTLYELEDDLKEKLFVRISKSTIVNIKAIRSIAPEDFRRIKLLLSNGEYLVVSRSYANGFKSAIGMKGGSGK
ncbi:MAG: LytTR family transcriptional regulator [Clostridiales bacterium]|nr:LytTR family transcriptional regulator [Clostridiales bacterium]